VALLAGWLWLCVLAAAAATAAGAAGALQPERKRSSAKAGWTSLLPLAAIALFAALVAAQGLAGVQGLALFGGQVLLSTASTSQTWLYLLSTLLYFGAWLLVRLAVNTAQRAERTLAAIVAVGVVQAIAAVLLWAAPANYEYLFTSFDVGGRAMGTYPSPDNLAGYLELCLSAGLGWLLAKMGGDGTRTAPGWRAATVAALTFVMSGKMLLRLLLVVMVIALVMSHSRAGNGVFFFSIGLVGCVVAIASRQLRRPAVWLVVSMALVDLLVIGQWVGLDRVVQRLQGTAEASSDAIAGFGLSQAAPKREESLAERLTVPRLSIRLVEARPWFGWGGGSYVTVFPPFKQGFLPHQWDHAHNDYVQVAADTGLVGLALWLTAGVATLVRALRLLSDTQPRSSRGLAVAALMALSCMGLHNVVDFNLHIPANAMTFTVLLALVWVPPLLPPLVRARRKRSSARASGNISEEN
jgi:O-antigen ligase